RVGQLAFCALAAALYPEGDGDRDAFCLAVLGALIASGVDIVMADHMTEEVARVAGDKAVRDTVFVHDDEGLDEFLALAGLQEIGHIVQSWLGLKAAEPDALAPERERRDGGDFVQGDVMPGVIDAETLRRLL